MSSPETAPAYRRSPLSALTAGVAVAAGPTLLHAVTINSKGTTGNVLTLYNNSSATGTDKMVIDTTSGPVTLFYDCVFDLGLFAVLATGVAADLVILWLPA